MNVMGCLCDDCAKEVFRGCSASYVTDEYHGWGCDVTGGACVFPVPDSKLCAEKYGEGPDVQED